ncbi:MAG: hypothetical protein CIT01_04020 [Methanobacterium sp. BRmetb2]|jgi:ferredoxin|nr:MAG: hypothetical protein CIT01_04020 [Methanobacterium sp. BRmetb2]
MSRDKKITIKKKVIKINKNECFSCGACIAVCKSSANEIVGTAVNIKQNKCDLCLACLRTCPISIIEMEEFCDRL